MKFREITIHTNSAGAEATANILVTLGVTCFVTEDPSDFSEFLENTAVPWDYVDDSLLKLASGECKQKVYLSDSTADRDKECQIREAIAALKETTDKYGELNITVETVDDSDWADNWKQYFKPLELGHSLVIKPQWENYTGERETVIEIDPGSAFGTGQHETTSLCLELIEETLLPGETVADIGCGSGILGIAALKLGASRVLAIDIDENAVTTAAENAAQNGCAESFETAYGNVNNDSILRSRLIDFKSSLIVANIVADVLVMMSPVFAAALATEKRLICSGIIDGRKDDVISSLIKNGFRIGKTVKKNDWVALLAIRD